MEDPTVYLVPIGAERFELYTEPLDDGDTGGDSRARDGFWHRQIQRLQEQWRRIAHAAHASGASAGRVARARDWLIRRIAESIAEQRALWSLRSATSALFVYPSDVSDTEAAAVRRRLLEHARRHHGWWLLVNLVAFAVTAVLVLLPGPNLIGYYFAFRVIGHYLSWRGARQALDGVVWSARAEPALTELGRLAHIPREERAGRVVRLASGLHLPGLAAFFDRVARPGR